MICVITVGTKVKITRRLYVGDDGWAFEIFLRVFFFFRVSDKSRGWKGWDGIDFGFMAERNGGMVGGGVMISEGTGRKRRL